jgi:inner membrane protein
MDTLTHALLGAGLAQAGFRRRLGRDAPYVAAVAAASPDLDMFFPALKRLLGQPVDMLAVFRYHRGLTHSLLMAPVFALGLSALWLAGRVAAARLRARRQTALAPSPGGAAWPSGRAGTGGRAWPWLFLCLLAVLASHDLLDLCTSYGTQLLAPLSDRRFALDAIGIIDLIFTSLVTVTLLATALARAWAPARAALPARIARTGLAACLAYLLVGWGTGLYLESHFGGPGIRQVRAYPQAGAISLWRVTRQYDDGHWEVRRWNMLHPGRGYQVNQADSVDDQGVQAARQLPQVQTFCWFARQQVRVSCHNQDGREVVDFHDMRYGPLPESSDSLWAMRVILGPDGSHQVYQFHYGRGQNRLDMLRRSWNDLWQ